MIKNALTELYSNLSYITLSGSRDFRFEAVSDLTVKISFLLKRATLQNRKREEIEQLNTAQSLNNNCLFTPKTEDPLDRVIEMLDDPNTEHKKVMCPYVPPQLQTADEIRTIQQLIDDDFIELESKFNEVNNIAIEQKIQERVADLVDDVLDEKNPFNSFENFWWEKDLCDKKDTVDTVDIAKNILNKIKESNPYAATTFVEQDIVDGRTIEQLVDDDFIELNNRTTQQLVNDDFIELEPNSKKSF